MSIGVPEHAVRTDPQLLVIALTKGTFSPATATDVGRSDAM